MRFASFFSGIGGFELGLEAAGHKCVFSCEIEPFCDTIFQARYGHGHTATDITKVKAEEIPDADIWVGGFPCQDLSVAGKRGGIKANRSGLVWRLLELAKIRKPQWLMLENVPGLLSSQRGGDFALLVRRLAELGYMGSYRCTDAQYFGVPQRRRRIFVVGRIGDECPLEVLLEPTCGQRDPAASREAGPGTATELARSLGSVSGGDDYAAGKGNLIGPRSGKDKAGALNFGTSPGFSDRGDGYDNLITDKPDKASAITASAGHHGHSSPRGDGTDNIVADQPNVPFGEKSHTVSKGSGGGLGGRDGQDDYVVHEPPPEDSTTFHRNASRNVSDQKGRAAALKANGEHSYQFVGMPKKPGEPSRKVAVPLTSGSNPNSNAAGRRQEDDHNLVVGAESDSKKQKPVEATPKAPSQTSVPAGNGVEQGLLFDTVRPPGEERLVPLPEAPVMAIELDNGSHHPIPGDGSKVPPVRPGNGPSGTATAAVAVNTEHGLAPHGSMKTSEQAPAIQASEGKGKTPVGIDFQNSKETGDKIGTLRAEGMVKQNTGAGVAVPLDLRNATRQTYPSEQNRQGLGIGEAGDPSSTVTNGPTPGVAVPMPPAEPEPIAFQPTAGLDVQAGAKCPTIKVGSGIGLPSPPAVLRMGNQGAHPLVKKPDVTDALGTGSGHGAGGADQAVAFEPRYYTRDNKTGGKPDNKVGMTNTHKAGDSAPHVMAFAERTREGEKQVEVMPGDKSPALLNPGKGGRTDAVRVCAPGKPFVKQGRAHNPEDGETWGDGDVSPTLNNSDNTSPIRATTAIVEGEEDKRETFVGGKEGETAPSITHSAAGTSRMSQRDEQNTIVGDRPAPAEDGPGMMVRRLTPSECERLQGGFDGWTCLCHQGEASNTILRVVWETFGPKNLSEAIRERDTSARVAIRLAQEALLQHSVREEIQGFKGGVQSRLWKEACSAVVSHVREGLRAMREEGSPDSSAPQGRKHTEQPSGEHRVSVRDLPLKRSLGGRIPGSESGEAAGGDGASRGGSSEGVRTQSSSSSHYETPSYLLIDDVQDSESKPSEWTFCLAGGSRIPPWLDPYTFRMGGCGHSACGCKCSDSPRYRALGNAVAVPNIRWIGNRLAVVEQTEKASA